jgi:excisionase family DNA binding protein
MTRADELAADGAMSVEAAAEFLSVSRAKAYALCYSGELPSLKIDGRRVVPRVAAKRFLAARLGRAAETPDPAA